MSDISSRNAEQPYERSRGTHITRRQALRTMAASSMALAGGAALAACGGTSSPSGPTDLTMWINPAVPEVAAPPSNWFLYSTVRKELNINLKVVLLPLGNDGVTKMSAAAAANNLPDFFQNISSNLLFQWVNLGLVAPVDDLLSRMPQRTKDRYSDATLNKLFTVNGKQYALPDNGGLLSKRGGYFIRKDLLDKHGLSMPQTVDDFMNVAKTLTANGVYGFGSILDTTTYSEGLGNYFAPLFGAYGLPGPWDLSTPGTLHLSVRNPAFMQAIEFVRGLVSAKAVDPDWTTLTTNDFRARWKQGKYGIFWEDFAAALGQSNYAPFDKNFPDAELVPLSPPAGPGGKSVVADYSSARFSWAVSQNAINAGKGPAIAKLLEWLNSGEGYYMASFGQKGVNYDLDSQGNVTTSGVSTPFTNAAAQPFIQIRNLSLNSSPPELTVRYPSYKTQNGRTIEPLQVLQQFSSMPWENGTKLGAIRPASNQADIDSYIEQGLVHFVTGRQTLDTGSWNSFIQGFDNVKVSDWETQAVQNLKDKGLLS
ncbi:MAG TPA: extracellular solute-binding protein [Ktedonobacteraceae bacterium]|nr:extracellular solute-binding protein [Ktedonobacteraceae bacterium]